MVEIVSLPPSQALKIVHQDNSPLVRLVTSGYNLTSEEKNEPLKATSVEYNYADERAIIFLAKQGEEIVGSLTFILWKDEPRDKRGSKFWPKLRELTPETVTRAQNINLLACDVGGIVTLPTMRGQGIGKLLYEKAIAQINPSILVGQTKTVEAVILRRTLESEGYRTFYGNTEITPGRPQSSINDHRFIRDAYLFARDIEELLPEGAVFLYHGGIAPTIPDTSNAPDIIREAFQPLILAQNRIVNTTVMAPLLSIRSEILTQT